MKRVFVIFFDMWCTISVRYGTPWCPMMEATTFFPLRRVIKTQLRHRHRHPDHHHVDIQQNIQSLWKHTIALKCLIPTHCKVKAMPWLWHIFSWSFQEIGTIVSIINSCCWVLLLLGGIVLLVLSWGSVVSVIPVQEQCGRPGGGDVSGVITVEPCLRKSTWDNNPIQSNQDLTNIASHSPLDLTTVTRVNHQQARAP